MLNLQIPSPLVELTDELLKEKKIRVFVKRDDAIHPVISGNKWRKLKYTFDKAKKEGHDTFLSFGGAYSNHLHALSYAAKELGFKSIGIIRGDELGDDSNQTLRDLKQHGMHLHFVSRSAYSRKEDPSYLQSLKNQFGNFYLIPEGGKSAEGVKGCRELVSEIEIPFDYITLACGTGTTAAGVISNLPANSKVLGFSVLKNGGYLHHEISKLVSSNAMSINLNWELILNYHFDGFGKTNTELLHFIKNFENKFSIPLDSVYNGKHFYGLFDLIHQNYFKQNSTIIAIHTGGLQGNRK